MMFDIEVYWPQTRLNRRGVSNIARRLNRELCAARSINVEGSAYYLYADGGSSAVFSADEADRLEAFLFNKSRKILNIEAARFVRLGSKIRVRIRKFEGYSDHVFTVTEAANLLYFLKTVHKKRASTD